MGIVVGSPDDSKRQDPSTTASPAPAPPSATPALGGVPGDARVPPSLRIDNNAKREDGAVVMAWQQNQTKNLQPSPLR